MSNLNIFASEFPNLETNTCKVNANILKRPTSSSLSNYECYSTNENCTGSFLTIRHTTSNKKILLADFMAFGSLIKKSEFKLLKPDVSKVYIGDFHAPGSNSFDNNYLSAGITKANPTIVYKNSFFRIDFEKVISIYGFIFVLRTYGKKIFILSLNIIYCSMET